MKIVVRFKKCAADSQLEKAYEKLAGSPMDHEELQGLLACALCSYLGEDDDVDTWMSYVEYTANVDSEHYDEKLLEFLRAHNGKKISVPKVRIRIAKENLEDVEYCGVPQCMEPYSRTSRELLRLVSEGKQQASLEDDLGKPYTLVIEGQASIA